VLDAVDQKIARRSKYEGLCALRKPLFGGFVNAHVDILAEISHVAFVSAISAQELHQHSFQG